VKADKKVREKSNNATTGVGQLKNDKQNGQTTSIEADHNENSTKIQATREENKIGVATKKSRAQASKRGGSQVTARILSQMSVQTNVNKLNRGKNRDYSESGDESAISDSGSEESFSEDSASKKSRGSKSRGSESKASSRSLSVGSKGSKDSSNKALSVNIAGDASLSGKSVSVKSLSKKSHSIKSLSEKSKSEKSLSVKLVSNISRSNKSKSKKSHSEKSESERSILSLSHGSVSSGPSEDDSASDYASESDSDESNFDFTAANMSEAHIDYAPTIVNGGGVSVNEQFYTTSEALEANFSVEVYAGLPDGIDAPLAPSEDGSFPDDKWYGRLVIPVARNWLWCKQSHLHVLDLYRSRREHERAQVVREAFKDNRQAWKSVRQNLNPRRKKVNRWLRFQLHENEFARVSEKYSSNFEESITILRAMKEGGASFCKDFENDLIDMENYTLHADYFDNLLQHAKTHNGATGAERPKLIEAREFVWHHWKNTQKHMDCHLEAIKANVELSAEQKQVLVEQAKDNKNAIKHLLIAKSKNHSIRCLLRMLIKRTTFGQVFLAEQGAQLSQVCTAHINKATLAMQAIQDIGGCECKAIVRRAGFKEEEFNEAQEAVQHFLGDWANVSPGLYDEKVNPDKRKSAANHVSQSAAVVYRTYMRFGLNAERALRDDPAAHQLAESIAEHGPVFKRECVDELRHVRYNLTPSYRRP